MNGIIPLYKPKGLTSHDCVMKVRRILKMKKVGHTGTLDPNVEGVLNICVGEATKVIPFILSLKKEYIAEAALGTSTTTEDMDGDVVDTKPMAQRPDINEIQRVLHDFCGETTQIPPMYSAVKVDGKKLYEYARSGIKVKRPERKVTIYEIEQMKETRENYIKLRVLCSKGTYIRTLCVDIGKRLGYPAHMASLIRTKSDGIHIEQTITFQDLEDLNENEKLNQCLLPVDAVLQNLDSISVEEAIKDKVLYGQKLPKPNREIKTEALKVLYNDTLLAIYETDKQNNQLIKPVRVFNLFKSEGE